MTLTPEPGDITPQAPPSVHFPAPLSEANMPRGIVPTPLPTCTLEQLSLSPRKFREAIFELLRGQLPSLDPETQLVSEGVSTKVYKSQFQRQSPAGQYSLSQSVVIKVVTPEIRKAIAIAESTGNQPVAFRNPLDSLSRIMPEGLLPRLPKLYGTVVTPGGATVAAVLEFISGCPVVDAILAESITFQQAKGHYHLVLSDLQRIGIRQRDLSIDNIFLTLNEGAEDPTVTNINPAVFERVLPSMQNPHSLICDLIFDRVEDELRNAAKK